MAYLYGAAVQGIQEFIFQTNKLREIVGASELVEEICTSKFARVLGKKGKYKELKELLIKDENAIVHAAGNIKYIFKTKEDCENIVRCFPKEVTMFAPGVTVSQAVVEYNEGEFGKVVKELESKLRTQRNKPMRYPMLGLMGIERSRQTGLPVCRINDNNHLDEATFAKLYYQKEDKSYTKRTTKKLCIKSFGKEISEDNIPFEISQMTGKNDWIAIIHADGNGLGQVVQKIGTEAKKFKEFSEKLDEATTQAAVTAFKEVVEKESSGVIPMRPIVLGGDDHTVICRADLAIPYVKCFIEQFEKKTEFLLGDTLKDVFSGKNKLTACAGIAYIKSSFPFYYGYELAESLCSRAKSDAKANLKEGELPPSCIMFHKVQDSFVENYNNIVERELKPQNNISLEFGPYYLTEKVGRWTIDNLLENVGIFDSSDGNAIKSGLRNWLSLLHSNVEQANQYMDRLKDVSGKDADLNKITSECIKREEVKVYPVYDMLAIHTIQTQETRNKEEQK